MRLRISLALAFSLAAAGVALSAESLETRAPTESKRLDRDENGKIDGYTETYVLNDDLSVQIFERIDEQTQAIKGGGASILYRDKPFWSEIHVPSLDERHTTVSPSAPFEIAMSNYARSGEATVALLDDDGRLVAALVKTKSGRFAPVTRDELARLQKLGEAVTDFAAGVLNRAEELKHDKDESDKLIRKLERSVKEYNQRESNDDSNESKNEAVDSK